jgi:hypothetical protein
MMGQRRSGASRRACSRMRAAGNSKSPHGWTLTAAGARPWSRRVRRERLADRDGRRYERRRAGARGPHGAAWLPSLRQQPNARRRSGLTAAKITDVNTSPIDPRLVLAGTANDFASYSSQCAVYRSIDGGTTWTPADDQRAECLHRTEPSPMRPAATSARGHRCRTQGCVEPIADATPR